MPLGTFGDRSRRQPAENTDYLPIASIRYTTFLASFTATRHGYFAYDYFWEPGDKTPLYTTPSCDFNNASFFFTFLFSGSSSRGLIDKNQVRDDGSATTCRSVTEVDPRYVEMWSTSRYPGMPPSGVAGATFILAE